MDGYLSSQQAAEKWNMSPRYVQQLCAEGRVEGASKFGKSWVIPETADRPTDKRVTSGAYRNWRKKSKD